MTLEGFHGTTGQWVRLGNFDPEFDIMGRLFTARTMSMSGTLMLDEVHIVIDDWSAFRLIKEREGQ